MRIVVFAGPSLPMADRAAFGRIEWRPPAEAGDLLRLMQETPRRICLIDGYFDHRPAVRHKEILLLLSAGVEIFGASSIGALRAAEMAEFGMTGVGAIYRAYASGRIAGDDEVALIHGPQEWDWRPISVPLVDVRATLCRALRHHILSAGQARSLMQAAAECHYVDRTWDEVLRRSTARDPLSERQRQGLRDNCVDQKRADARACLVAATTWPKPAKQVRPEMVRTRFVDALARECGVELRSRGPGRGARKSLASARHSGTADDRMPSR